MILQKRMRERYHLQSVLADIVIQRFVRRQRLPLLLCPMIMMLQMTSFVIMNSVRFSIVILFCRWGGQFDVVSFGWSHIFFLFEIFEVSEWETKETPKFFYIDNTEPEPVPSSPQNFRRIVTTEKDWILLKRKSPPTVIVNCQTPLKFWFKNDSSNSTYCYHNGIEFNSCSCHHESQLGRKDGHLLPYLSESTLSIFTFFFKISLSLSLFVQKDENHTMTLYS